MIFDPGATVNCQRSAANCYNIKDADIKLATAINGEPATIGAVGEASVVVIDEHGKQQLLHLGRTLIDPSLKNLISPSAMFQDNDEVFSVTLSRRQSYFLLRNGKQVPLRWDGRLFYLDYISGATPHVSPPTNLDARNKQVQQVQLTEQDDMRQMFQHGGPVRIPRSCDPLPAIAEERQDCSSKWIKVREQVREQHARLRLALFAPEEPDDGPASCLLVAATAQEQRNGVLQDGALPRVRRSSSHSISK